MLGYRQIRMSMALGLAAAAGWLLAAGSASAEWRVETSTSPPAGAETARAGAPPQGGAASRGEPRCGLARAPAADNPEEEEREGEETRGQQPRPTPRCGTTDGDAGSQTEPRGPQDGIIDVGEPTAAPRRHLQTCARTPERRRTSPRSTSPPAGYNPYLFQIELDPLTDRRTLELFYLEPYVASGIRVGSFVVFPEAQIGATATTTSSATPRVSPTARWRWRSNVRVVSDWRTHAVEFRASGLATFYEQFPTEDDRSYAFEARGRLDSDEAHQYRGARLAPGRQGRSLGARLYR